MMSSLSRRLRLILAWSVAAILRRGQRNRGGSDIEATRNPHWERIEQTHQETPRTKQKNARQAQSATAAATERRRPAREGRGGGKEETHHIWPSGAFRARSWCE